MNGKLFFVIFSFFIWNLSLLFASKSLKLLTGLVSPSAMMNNQKNLLIPKHRGISTWQIPGKIKHSESNLTTSSVIRFLGVLYTHPSYGTIEYQNFGTGHVLVPYGDSYQEKNLNFPCVYMTNINSNIRKKWKPLVREDPLGVLGITIECAIPQSTEGDKFASILRLEKALTVTVSIFTPNLTNSLQDSYLLQQSEKFTPLQLPHASQYQPQYRSLPAHIHTTIKMENPTVITVQTFMNNISGPSLYMFVLYYMNLDYGIIIYDMYGLHQSYLQQFIDQEIIDYHSFTVFENIFPHVFNYQRYQKEYKDMKFKYWHFMDIFINQTDSNMNYEIDRMNKYEMLNQDDNKRLTVDSAIFNYSHLVSSLLYVDRDELLFCPEGTYHVETQRAYQHDFIRRVLFQHNHDQILFQRFNYASVVNLLSSKEFSSSASSSNASPSSSLTDQYIQQVLESCIINSYQKRSIFAFFHCFSSVTIYKSKEKCLFQTNSCPFHELHHACLRCRCKTIPVTKPSNIQK